MSSDLLQDLASYKKHREKCVHVMVAMVTEMCLYLLWLYNDDCNGRGEFVFLVYVIRSNCVCVVLPWYMYMEHEMCEHMTSFCICQSDCYRY